MEVDAKLKALGITALSIATLAIGFLTPMLNIQAPQIIPPNSSPLMLITITLGFGMLFFGYLPWIITYFIGNHLILSLNAGQMNEIQAVLIAISTILTAFASAWLGSSLYNDLTGKQSKFQKELKKNTIIIIIAIIIALIAEYAL